MQAKNYLRHTIFLVLTILPESQEQSLTFFHQTKVLKTNLEAFTKASGRQIRQTPNLLDCVSACKEDPKCRLLHFDKGEAICTLATEGQSVTGKLLFPRDNSDPEKSYKVLLRDEFYERGEHGFLTNMGMCDVTRFFATVTNLTGARFSLLLNDRS